MPLPSFAQAWLQARETSEAGLCLLTIHHPMMETFRLVKNTASIVSRGDTFAASYFDLDVVNDDDQPARATLTIPNVDRSIGIELRKLVGPPEVTIEVVGAAHLDEPIYRAARLEVRNISLDPLTISGDLVRHDYGAEICGTIKITPARAPALFRRR
jgi:hypothetical protein